MTKKTSPEQQHHFYASTALDWSTAPTRAEAIRNVARSAGAKCIAHQKKEHGGLYVWSARIGIPQSSHYTISHYAPEFIVRDRVKTEERVPVDGVKEGKIVTVNGYLAIED